MRIIGYGEDALTLWAIKNKMEAILQQLNDNSDVSQCQVFFRPSFGRSGGNNSAQFGEFDFIILSQSHLYLGESKWDRSSEKKDDILELREEQKLRHEIFRLYVDEWLKRDYSSWIEFLEKSKESMRAKGMIKPLAPVNSLLSSNLQTLLQIIKKHFNCIPKTKNALLYLHNGRSGDIPKIVSNSFELVLIDYSIDSIDNFIKINV